MKTTECIGGGSSNIHGAGDGINEGGSMANGYTGMISPDWDI